MIIEKQDVSIWNISSPMLFRRLTYYLDLSKSNMNNNYVNNDFVH